MMYTIRVSDGVDKVIAKWKKSNPNLFKKYKKIYKELLEHPKTGLGHPEALRGGGDITWSRHITMSLFSLSSTTWQRKKGIFFRLSHSM